MHIFLIGFMGSGKSYWGRQWAAAHGFHFIDLDQQIEARAQQTVAAIFEQQGEAHFRELEAMQLRSLSSSENCIVACGGGTPCYGDNMKWMNAHGITVYLEASAGFIMDKVKDETSQRPLLKKVNPAELLFYIEQKLKERAVFYGQARHVLNAAGLTVSSLSEIISPHKL